MWDLSSLTRDQTCTPCIGNRVLTTGLPGNLLYYRFCEMLLFEGKLGEKYTDLCHFLQLHVIYNDLNKNSN